MQPIGTLTGWDTLRHSSAGWELEGNCEVARCRAKLTLDPFGVSDQNLILETKTSETDQEPEAAWIDRWNQALKAGWRSGFDRIVVASGPATVELTGEMDGSAQLFRHGVDPAFAKVWLGNAAGMRFPANLAMHPTGVEAYLCAWPSPLVIAFDPLNLQRHWTLPLDGASQGLFVESSGRFLLVGTGSAGTEPWSWTGPDATENEDPYRDEVLRRQSRPPISAVEVVDLQNHEVRVELKGRYRRWLSLEDGRKLVATDQELVFFQP